jgi:hypothetical protein
MAKKEAPDAAAAAGAGPEAGKGPSKKKKTFKKRGEKRVVITASRTFRRRSTTPSSPSRMPRVM